MAKDFEKTKQSIEYERAINDLQKRIEQLEAKVTALETWKATGTTTSNYYVCNDDATYNATNSKIMAIINGIITGIS